MTNGHLVLLLSILVVSVNCQRAPETCTTQQVDSGELFCQNCLTVVRCNTASSPPDIVNICSVGQVCGNVDNTVGCTTSIHLTDCNCNNLICDPYEENTVAVCSSAGILAHSKCQNGQICLKGTCVAESTTTTTPHTTTSYTTIPPTPTTTPQTSPTPPVDCQNAPVGVIFPDYGLLDCYRAVYCASKDAEPQHKRGTCGGYYDASMKTCAPLPPHNCYGCYNGRCADKKDCTKYAVCIEGVQIQEIQCPEVDGVQLYYDTVDKRCMFKEDAKCHLNTACKFRKINSPNTTPDDTDYSTIVPPTTLSPTALINRYDDCRYAPLNILFPSYGKCLDGLYCASRESKVQVNESCYRDSYFDTTLNACEILLPEHCLGCYHGRCPHKLDCTKYVLCVEGVATQEVQCPDEYGEQLYFDIVDKVCRYSKDATCHGNTVCDIAGNNKNVHNIYNPSKKPATTNPRWCTGKHLGQIHVDLPDCKIGIYCDENSVSYYFNQCYGDDRYFDKSYGGCVNLPFDHCKGCTENPCPHKTDCSKYVNCIDGNVAEIYSCSTPNRDFLFDSNTRRCVSPEFELTCHENTLCVYNNFNETTHDWASPSPAYNNYITYSPSYNNYTNWTTYYPDYSPDYDNWTTYSPNYNNWTTYYPPDGPFPNNTGEDPNCKDKGNYSEGTVSIFYHFMAKWRTFLANFN